MSTDRPSPVRAPPAGRVLDAAFELLDRQLVDAQGRAAGKVDDLKLTRTADGGLVVSAILSGPMALGPRLGGQLGVIWAAFGRRLQPDADPRPSRVPADLVRHMDDVIQLSIDADDLDSLRLERWIAEHIIDHIPGSDHEP